MCQKTDNKILDLKASNQSTSNDFPDLLSLQFFKTSMLTVFLAAALASGGCGTEVGNGFSGPGETPEESSTKRQSSADEGSSDADSGEPVSSPDTSKPVVENTSMEEEIVVVSKFDQQLLFSSCGSPFGEKIQSPVSLINSAGVTLKASLQATEWDLKISNQTVAYVQDKSPTDYSVTVVDQSRAVLSSEFTCGDITDTQNISILSFPDSVNLRSVRLTRGTEIYDLSWFVSSATNGSGESDLVRIDILEVGASTPNTFVKPAVK